MWCWCVCMKHCTLLLGSFKTPKNLGIRWCYPVYSQQSQDLRFHNEMPWICTQNWQINPHTLTSKPSPLKKGKRNVLDNTDHKRGIKSINAHACNVCKVGVDITHTHIYTNHSTETFSDSQCDMWSSFWSLSFISPLTSLWDRKQLRYYTFANFLDFVWGKSVKLSKW